MSPTYLGSGAARYVPYVPDYLSFLGGGFNVYVLLGDDSAVFTGKHQLVLDLVLLVSNSWSISRSNLLLR